MDRLEIPDNLRNFLRVPDMKTYFGYGKWKTWALIAQGKIKAIKDGREWHIKTASVLRYFEKMEYKGGLQNVHNS